MDGTAALIEKNREMIREIRALVSDTDELCRSKGIDPERLREIRAAELSPAMQAEVKRLVQKDLQAVEQEVADARARARREGNQPIRNPGKRLRMMI